MIAWVIVLGSIVATLLFIYVIYLRVAVSHGKLRIDMESILPKKGTLCFQCKKEIISDDDDAFVCISCGGRNRRKPKDA